MSHQTLQLALPAEPAGSCPIHIGSGLLEGLDRLLGLDAFSGVFALTDENVAPHWLPRLGGIPALVLPAGEAHKQLATVERVWAFLHERGCDRHGLLLDLGGGVIGDLGGFAAATFLRGIDFVQLPTTLLAQVDAAVGGKVGVNFAGAKNRVGAFRHPRAVVADLDTLSTLPRRELRSGMAEVIKHGLTFDRAYLDEAAAWNAGDVAATVSLVRRSCELKGMIVAADQREDGLRKLLNFGHTVGHAVESLSHEGDAPWLHGEAVAVGMVAAAEISRLTKRIDEADVAVVERVLLDQELPVRLDRSMDVEEILQHLPADKKNVAGEVRWTLLESLGHAVPDVVVDDATVREALKRLTDAACPPSA